MSTRTGRWVDARVSDALADAFAKIQRGIDAGDHTIEDVTVAIEVGWGDGVAEGWHEWVDEGNDG